MRVEGVGLEIEGGVWEVENGGFENGGFGDRVWRSRD